MENSEEEPLIVNRVPGRETDEKGSESPPLTRPVLMSIVTAVFNCSLMITNMTVNQYVYKWLGDNYGNTSGIDNVTTICTNNGSSRENEIQKIASKWIWYLSLVEYGLPIIFVLTLGVYSDFIGRKPIMLISLIGNSLMNGVFALLIFYNLNLTYFLIAFAIGALAGSRYSFHIGYLGSVTDTTGQNKNRSFKIAILDILMAVGSSSGNIITGYVISYAGYMYPVIISCGFCFLGAIIVLIFIPETFRRRRDIKFSFRSGWRNLTGFYWNRDNVKRNKNWLFGISLLSFTVFFAPLVSRLPIETLFQLRSPFCFSSDLIGWFQFTKECLHSVFGTLLVKLFHRCIDDATIAFIGCFTGSAYFIVMGFSKKYWMMYIAVAVGVLSTVPLPMYKGMTSRMVDSDKQGALFSNIVILQIVCRLAGNSAFNNIYAHTQDIMPGITFYVMSGFYLAAAALLIPAMTSIRKNRNIYEDNHSKDEG